MEQPEKIERNFNKTDLLMLEQSQTMQANFITDKVAFVAKFTMLADPFAANWQAAITAADALPGDENVENESKMLTNALTSEMLAARNHYQSMLTYLRQAFPKDKAVLELFGQNQYEKARNSQLKMIELMELAGAKANLAPYKAALIAKGFSQANITLLATIEQNLRTKNKAQESFISARPLATQTRSIALNNVWAFNVTVHDAAEVVFKDDFAKQQQYLLYPEATPTLPGIFNISPNGFVTVDRIALDTPFNNTGTTDLSFKKPSNPTVQVLVPAGTSITVGANFIPLIEVHNESATVAGQFSIVQQ